MTDTKPIASLSLDLDNQWSYMKTHGDDGWQTFPSYLDLVIPRVLQFLKERQLSITIFIVGQDAALAKNHEALGTLATAGHEIGNHSFAHEPWLHLYSKEQIETELAQAEEHIERVTGHHPMGFRGPGYSLSPTTLQVLIQRGYLYDASTFPTFLGPLARAYYFMHMRRKLQPEERHQRQQLFGTLQDGLLPLNPYRWKLDTGTLIEIPVTTMPVFKVPIHLSYILYLSTIAPALALSYFRVALRLCRLMGHQPSLLLHPLDFLGRDDIQALSFFPGMQLHHEQKLEIVHHALQHYMSAFTVVPVHQHAKTAARGTNLSMREPHAA